MKIQALVMAVALAGGAASAATPSGTARMPNPGATTTTTTTTSKTVKQHRKIVKKQHVARNTVKQKVSRENLSRAPQTDVDDKSRQGRMDEALANYRQGRS